MIRFVLSFALFFLGSASHAKEIPCLPWEDFFTQWESEKELLVAAESLPNYRYDFQFSAEIFSRVKNTPRWNSLPRSWQLSLDDFFEWLKTNAKKSLDSEQETLWQNYFTLTSEVLVPFFFYEPIELPDNSQVQTWWTEIFQQSLNDLNLFVCQQESLTQDLKETDTPPAFIIPALNRDLFSARQPGNLFSEIKGACQNSIFKFLCKNLWSDETAETPIEADITRQSFRQLRGNEALLEHYLEWQTSRDQWLGIQKELGNSLQALTNIHISLIKTLVPIKGTLSEIKDLNRKILCQKQDTSTACPSRPW